LQLAIATAVAVFFDCPFREVEFVAIELVRPDEREFSVGGQGERAKKKSADLSRCNMRLLVEKFISDARA